MKKVIIRHLVTVLKGFNDHNIGDEIFLKDRNFKELQSEGFVELKEEDFPQIKQVTPKAKRTSKK